MILNLFKVQTWSAWRKEKNLVAYLITIMISHNQPFCWGVDHLSFYSVFLLKLGSSSCTSVVALMVNARHMASGLGPLFIIVFGGLLMHARSSSFNALFFVFSVEHPHLMLFANWSQMFHNYFCWMADNIWWGLRFYIQTPPLYDVTAGPHLYASYYAFFKWSSW